MPTTPNADTTLSGGSGTTKTALLQRVLRRLDDNPWTDTHSNALTASDTSLTVLTTTPYQRGGWIDWVEDGTFETALITDVPNTTTLTVRRGHRGTTAAIHSANAVFRYRGRVQPHNLSEITDDVLDSMWPELFDVRHVDWTISTSVTPEIWYALPANAERVTELYQRTNSTPVDLRQPGAWGGPVWVETGFLGGAVPKGLQVYGTAINSADNRLHAIYLARLALSTLTAEQIAILTYMVGATALETVVAGETKPERRANLGGTPVPTDAVQLWVRQAAELKRKEQERLMEYIPRRNRVKFRGGRHYSDYGFMPHHAVRPY